MLRSLARVRRTHALPTSHAGAKRQRERHASGALATPRHDTSGPHGMIAPSGEHAEGRTQAPRHPQSAKAVQPTMARSRSRHGRLKFSRGRWDASAELVLCRNRRGQRSFGGEPVADGRSATYVHVVISVRGRLIRWSANRMRDEHAGISQGRRELCWTSQGADG